MHASALYSELILASTSAARRQLLDGLGLPYRVVAPEVPETYSAGISPAQAVALLAERKARAVLARFPEALVIGADQLVSLDGQALGKPSHIDEARKQLYALRDRQHEICTAVTVVGPGFLETDVDVARLRVAALTDVEIDRYLALGEWQGCAGAYRVEGRGQALFKEIDGDRTSIQGLPMQRLVQMLRDAQIRFF